VRRRHKSRSKRRIAAYEDYCEVYWRYVYGIGWKIDRWYAKHNKRFRRVFTIHEREIAVDAFSARVSVPNTAVVYVYVHTSCRNVVATFDLVGRRNKTAGRFVRVVIGTSARVHVAVPSALSSPRSYGAVRRRVAKSRPKKSAPFTG